MPFCHAVLLFGALGAVWGYGRLNDLFVHLTRCLVAIRALHYVDDFGGIERSASAPSAFSAFEDFNTCLGYVMKKAKRQPRSRLLRPKRCKASSWSFTARGRPFALSRSECGAWSS